jgi:hypothetical protein
MGTGIMSSNPNQGMEVCSLCSMCRYRPYDGLISNPGNHIKHLTIYKMKQISTYEPTLLACLMQRINAFTK